MKRILENLVKRIKSANDLQAVFTVKDSPEMAAAELHLASHIEDASAVALNALKAAQFAMTNQRYNLPRIGMEREYGLVCSAVKQIELEQFMEREGLGTEDMANDVGWGGLPR